MNTDTPRTDEWETYCDESYYHLWRVRRKNERGFNDGYHVHDGEEAKALVDLLNKQDSELTAVTEQRDEAETDFKCLAELLDGHDATECRMNLVRLKEQRDGLAVALRKAVQWADCASIHMENRHEINWTHLNEAKEALAAVKGGSDE